NVLERDPQGERLVYRAAAGWPAEWIDRRTVDLQPGSHLEHTLARGEPLVIEDHATDRRFPSSGALRAFGVRSSVHVPILGTQGAFGILAVHAKQARRFSEDEVNF